MRLWCRRRNASMLRPHEIAACCSRLSPTPFRRRRAHCPGALDDAAATGLKREDRALPDVHAALEVDCVESGFAELDGGASGAGAAAAGGDVALVGRELSGAVGQGRERDVLRSGSVAGLPLAALADVEDRRATTSWASCALVDGGNRDERRPIYARFPTAAARGRPVGQPALTSDTLVAPRRRARSRRRQSIARRTRHLPTPSRIAFSSSTCRCTLPQTASQSSNTPSSTTR